MLLKIENLNKSYKKNVVLKNLSLAIDNDKDLIALIGLNGSGKSTLIEILCGIKDKDSGKIFYKNKEIKHTKNILQFKYEFGYMPQYFSLFNDLTVAENLKYIYSVYQLNDISIIQKTINKCGLMGKEKLLAKDLSGGFKQLLSFASAIIHNPKLLILDEPTSAMDPLFRKQFWNIVSDFNDKGTAVIVTTHYTDEIFNCKKIFCLNGGRIIHQKNVEDIYENGKFKSIDEVLNYYIMAK